MVAGRKRVTEDERDQVIAFVEAVYERLGAVSWADFARKAGLSYASVMEWRGKRSGPSAANLIRMLQATGHLDEGARFTERPIEVAEELVRRLDAGETFPKAELERVAKLVERAAAPLPHLAARLREGARAGRRAR